jgi:predicted amidohydrolase YtcJ
VQIGCEIFVQIKKTKAKVMLNGSSDHTVRQDADRTINPNIRFRGHLITVVRGEENRRVTLVLSRENTSKMSTVNNPFCEFSRKIKRFKVGNLADLVVLLEDLLTCRRDFLTNIRR